MNSDERNSNLDEAAAVSPTEPTASGDDNASSDGDDASSTDSEREAGAETETEQAETEAEQADDNEAKTKFSWKWILGSIVSAIVILIVLAALLEYSSSSSQTTEEAVDSEEWAANDGIDYGDGRGVPESEPEFSGDAAAPQPDYAETGEISDGGAGDNGLSDINDSERFIISTAEAVIGIELDEMQNSVRDAEDLVEDNGGHVESREERYSPYEGDVVTTRLEFRVPSENHAAVMSAISDLGEVERVTENSDDVTDTMIELETRIENAEASLERLRDFLDEAETVEELMTVEQQLNQRQANLEVMLAQQESLADRADMSTVRIIFTAEVDREAAIEEDPFEVRPFEPEGFTGGLERGWSAIVVVVNTVLAGAGILLPWTPVVLVVALVWAVIVLKKRKNVAGSNESVPTSTAADGNSQ